MANHTQITSVILSIIILLVVQSISAGRPPLCQVPVKWMVDQDGLATMQNGSYSPITESKGNVSVIFFLKASEATDQIQASRMKDMVNFLRSTGLTDIKFFVVNSRETPSREARFRMRERVSGSDIHVFQETESVPLWDHLKGSRGDLFIYDRCGRLTYYIPSPLSMLSARAPIAQATILSAYFDNPCGTCVSEKDVHDLSSSPPTLTTDATSDVDLMSSTEGVEGFTEVYELSDTTVDPVDDTLLVSNTSEIQLRTLTNILDLNATLVRDRKNDSRNGHVMLRPWKIFEFLLTGPSNVSIQSNVTVYGENITTVTTASPPSQEMLARTRDTIVSVPVQVPSEENSTLTILTCEASQCVEFSTDTILRARLCCLREEVGSDGEATIGCRTYTRTTCSQMLPLIKCCLKDFSQLLANYFRSQSNGRKRTSPGYVG